MKPKAFNFYLDYLENIEDLSDEQIGVLTRALLVYANTGEIIEMELAVKQTFKPIKKQIDADFAKYEAKVKQCKEAGASGGNAKAANAKNETENIANAKKNVANVANAKNDVAKCSERSEEEDKDEDEKENNNNSLVIFDEFWTAYPKKRNKPDAQRAFKKLKADDKLLSAMLNALKKHKQLRQWQDKQYIPNPATWLNGHMWEDEITSQDINAPNKYTSSYIQRDDQYDDTKMFDYIDKADNMSGLEYIFEGDENE